LIMIAAAPHQAERSGHRRVRLVVVFRIQF
jgi:hypothetical protein